MVTIVWFYDRTSRTGSCRLFTSCIHVSMIFFLFFEAKSSIFLKQFYIFLTYWTWIAVDILRIPFVSPSKSTRISFLAWVFGSHCEVRSFSSEKEKPNQL